MSLGWSFAELTRFRIEFRSKHAIEEYLGSGAGISVLTEIEFIQSNEGEKVRTSLTQLG